ncbi:putative ribonuclease H-like domain-containing protein [Tanacetum coccineum]|uniref:Ribonuclease H-like domain-containing protein n=1 Tax=Tanacetum coccineum TaxID=301880 RepID=A0ABQ4YUM3_9ASTR
MHKDAQQAVGGPTSLGPPVKKEPTLNSVVSLQDLDYYHSVLDSMLHLLTVSEVQEENKAGGLIRILEDIRYALFTPDSPQDDPIIVTDESKEEEDDKEGTYDTSHDMSEDTLVPPPPSLKSAQIQELIAQVQLLKYVVPTGRVIATISIKVPTWKGLRLQVVSEPGEVSVERILLSLLPKLYQRTSSPYPTTTIYDHSPAVPTLDSSQVVSGVPIRRHNLYCFNLTDIHSEREIKCLLAKASLDESTKWHRRMAHVNFKNMNKLAKHGLLRLNNAPMWKNVENIPLFVPRPAYVPAGSRNRPTSVPTGNPFPAGSRNRPTSSLVGLAHITKWIWMGEDGELLLRPQQVVLGTDNPHTNKDLGIVDSGCSRSMTGNKEKLADFVKIKGGTVTFGGGDGKITGKGTIRTSNFNFENVYYVEELQNFNLFSVSQICDTKNKVLFTDKECLVLSKEFQLPDSSQVVLRVPRRHNLYCFNLTDIHSEREIKCLLAKASLDESTKWHRRMAHVNFKNMNKLAKHGLVNGLPSKLFTNEHNCVACNKGKQHKASYKAITAVSTISEPLQLLHMDLFGPTSIRSIDHKHYSLVVTDDFSRFSWVFFLGTKDETFYILRDFITFVENQLTKKVKAIRCDNGTEFKNSNLIELCGSKGIKRDYSIARTPQQNGVVVDPVPTRRVHTVHLISQIIGDITSPVLTRGTLKKSKFGESALAGYVHDQQRNNHTDYLHYMFACFLSQLEPSSVAQALNDPDWVEAMQEEMRQFVNQDIICLIHGFYGISNGCPSVHLLYEEIDEDSLCTQPKRIGSPFYPKHVYRVVKALYGLHQAQGTWVLKDDIIFGSITRPWCDEFDGVDEGEFELSVRPQAKYVQDMLRRFDMESVRPATTPYEAAKPKSKDEPDDAVNVYLYRSMIGSLMYLTASRPDIMFAVSACSRTQGTPYDFHLNAVKKIFKYLKGQPKLGLWYPRDSPFMLEAYSDSDYAGSNGDRKSTTGGCQFLGRRLISWQCKKQTVVATSSTEAEYVAAAHCCGQSFLLVVNTGLYWSEHIFYGCLSGLSAGDGQELFLLDWILEKPKGFSTDIIQVINILLDSHIRYAIVTDPLILDSLINPILVFGSLESSELGPQLLWHIDGTSLQITESLERSKLYTKSGSWDQFGSPLAIALICLCEGKEVQLNWSRYIFTGMVNNINNSKKFLMFPRFLQMILDIETRITKPYHAVRLTSKMFANMRLNFHGDHMPLVAAMLPPPQAAIAAGTSGEAASPNPQPDHATVTKPVHQTVSSHDHGSTSPRQTPRPIPTSPSAQVNQKGPSSDPHVESSSKANDSNPDPTVADDPLGGSFFASPSRSTAAPPDGTTSGGAEDLLTLTALYTLVSEQGKKIGSLESELQAHKLLFKDVMGRLVKRVKILESKLKARGRNVILSESDNEEDEEQDVDSLIKLAKAAAIAADTSSVPADAAQATEFPPSSSIPTDAFVHGNVVPTGTASDFSADPSNKGKSPMVEEDPPIKERSFRQMEEDRLGAEAARKLYEEEQAELARVQEEMNKKRQEDVINSAKYYTDADWSDIMGQVHANQGLTADLLGPNVNADNFAERMVALIAERRRTFEAQSSTIYSTGWTLKYVKTFTDDQLKAEFDKIRNAAADLQAQNLRRSLKRPGVDVEQPGSKKSKSSVAQQTPTPAVTPDSSVDPPVAPTPSFATSDSRSSGPTTRSQSSPTGIQTYSTRRKSLATRNMSSSVVDLNAPDESFIHVLSNDDSDASNDDTDPLFLAYICCMGSCSYWLGQDLSKLYGMVVKHYEVKPLAGTGMILWGDLHVLFESSTGGSSVEVWNDQQEWVIHTPYPLSASLLQKMLKHKLEVEIDGIGNDMTYAVQLIQFIKNQLALSVFGWFLRSINLAAAVFVAVSILKALKTEDLSRKLEVNYVKF